MKLGQLCYHALVLASMLFALTVLVHTVVAREHQPPWLWAHGWQIVLGELGVLIVLGVLCLALDRPDPSPNAAAPTPEVRHEQAPRAT